MLSVNIAELKARLSFYLKQVQAGREIIIRDRQKAIGRLMPMRQEDLDEHLRGLCAEGKLRLGAGEIDEDFWRLPRPRIKGKTLQEMMDEERAE